MGDGARLRRDPRVVRRQRHQDRARRVRRPRSFRRPVWGDDYEGGSNVVAAVVKGLRRKLRAHAPCIETVAGHRLSLPRTGVSLGTLPHPSDVVDTVITPLSTSPST